MGKPRKYPEGKEAVTVKEAADILGISRHTMYARVKDNTIPSFKIGRLRRISRKALDNLMHGESKGGIVWQ